MIQFEREEQYAKGRLKSKALTNVVTSALSLQETRVLEANPCATGVLSTAQVHGAKLVVSVCVHSCDRLNCNMG